MSGRERFDAWLYSPPTQAGAREAFLKIGAGAWPEIDRLIEITFEYEKAALTRLSQLGQAEFPQRVDEVGLWQASMEGIGEDGESAQIRTTLEWLATTRDWLKWIKRQMLEGPRDQGDESRRSR